MLILNVPRPAPSRPSARCPTTKLEPFLGIIVGPYDTAMPHPISVITTFTVQTRNSQLVPYFVRWGR